VAVAIIETTWPFGSNILSTVEDRANDVPTFPCFLNMSLFSKKKEEEKINSRRQKHGRIF
jgi:hypothetical protein